MVNCSISGSNEQRNDDAVFGYLTKIEDFILPDKSRAEVFSNYVKHFSDLKCSLLPSSFTTVAPLSVHVQGFESEQIYQQLQTINEERSKSLTALLIKAKTKTKTFGDLLRPPSPVVEKNVDEPEHNEEEEEEVVEKKPTKKKKSVTFYDQNALDRFLEEQDRQEMANSSRNNDLDEDDEDEDDEEELFPVDENSFKEPATYDEFFDPPAEKSKKKNKKNQREQKTSMNGNELDEKFSDDEEEEEVLDLEGKSDFEKQQIRLKQQIKSIEKEMLSSKAWQLTGEIEAQKRPENSLLEEYLQFDRTARLPPTITTETTDSIEELIKQRIRDKAFDDVERKKRTSQAQEMSAYKKEIVLDHEKSQLSLAQVYEQEFVKKQNAEKSEKKDERHELIRKMMQDLFVDLDALSNFRFTPRPPAPEVTVVNNVPAILVEEVIPSTVNDATLLAPEEIHQRPKGEVKATTERTDTDKKHARRLIKKKLKLTAEVKAKSSNDQQDEKEEKRTLLKKLGKMKNVRIEKTDKKHSGEKTGRSSTKFFEKLQQSTEIEPKKKRRSSQSVKTTDSKRLKL